MNIVIGIALALMELITACYILWLSYITGRWVAEHITGPLWWKVNDFILAVYAWIETETWLNREEDKNECSRSESPGDPAGGSGERSSD